MLNTAQSNLKAGVLMAIASSSKTMKGNARKMPHKHRGHPKG